MHHPAPEDRRFPFTKTRLEVLPVPTAGRAVYYDAKTPGLILRITETGQRSFCFYRKVKGRPLRMLLGRFPQMTVEKARKACEAASGGVAAGKDPLAERRAAGRSGTVPGVLYPRVAYRARRANVQAMRWEDISFDLGFWRIPDTKSGKPVVVPLSPQAMEILRSHKERCKPSPWVFPSHGKTGHLVEPKSAWKRLLARAGLSDVRVHDLRRTLGSWQAITGASLPIIGKSLGHGQPATTAIYSRLALDPVPEFVDKANTAMLQASRGEPAIQLKDNPAKPADSTTVQKPTEMNERPSHG